MSALARALRDFLHGGEFARFHDLPELLAHAAGVDPDRVSVEVVAGPRLRMEIHGEPGEQWADYAAAWAGQAQDLEVWASFGIFDGDDELPRPLRYRQSHVLPSPTDDRAGALHLGLIPGFITRDGRDDGPEDEDDCWPYLRVSISDGDDLADVTVVLDADQVTFLHEALGNWLGRVHRADPDGSSR